MARGKKPRERMQECGVSPQLANDIETLVRALRRGALDGEARGEVRLLAATDPPDGLLVISGTFSARRIIEFFEEPAEGPRDVAAP